MRSLYLKILLASFGTILLSVAGFYSVYNAVSVPALRTVFRGFEAVMAEDAADAYRRGGPPGAEAYLKQIDGTLPMMTHYLVDPHGIDVVSGLDRSALLGTRLDETGRVLMVSPSADGHYQLITAAVPPFGIGDFVPYGVLMLAAIAFVCWLLAVGIASPLREMVAAVNDFGRGNLAARVAVSRRDEIGELARSFNDMAGRIQTLVSAERRLLQDVSHELRSPLTRLGMAIELSRAAADRDGAIDRVQREADRLNHLVRALLEVTGLEGDTETTLAGTVSPAEIVREVVADCDLDAQAAGCRILVETKTEKSTAGNAELLRRAFDNVLRNAIHYAPSDTLVEVGCEERGDAVAVSVRDYGPGVPEDALSQLGSPFYRVDPSRSASTGGLGLGLSLARRAIQLHHGAWVVENANPGLRLTMIIPGVPGKGDVNKT